MISTFSSIQYIPGELTLYRPQKESWILCPPMANVQVPQGEVIFEEKWALGQLSQIVFGPQFQTFTCDAGCYNLASEIF